MALKSYFPFARNAVSIEEKALKQDEIKVLGKSIKIAALALGFRGSSYYYDTRASFEPSPYDFHRITQAYDTDGYVRQSVAKHKELFFERGMGNSWRKSRSYILSLQKNRLYGNDNEETFCGVSN